MSAEQSVVAKILADPKIAGAVIDSGLLPEHFSTGAGRTLYEEIYTSYLADDPIDAVTVGELCSKRLARLWEIEPGDAVVRVRQMAKAETPGKAADHAQLVRRAAMFRDLGDLARSVGAQAEAQDATPEEIAGLMAERATQIATSAMRDNEWIHWDDLGKHFEKQQKKLMVAVAKGQEQGAYFGLRFIDGYIRGLRPTELLILAGPPGAGKSHVAWKMAVRFAERQLKKPEGRRIGTAIFSLEMGEDESNERFATSVSGVDGGKIREGRTDNDDLKKIIAEWGDRAGLPLWLNFSAKVRAAQMKAMVIEAIRRDNIGLLIVDHFRYFDMDGRFAKPEDADEAKARFLHNDIAKELNVAVICLAHTIKIGQRENKRPTMDDLRGGGMVAAHANWIGFVHRPYEYATPEEQEKMSRHDAELVWSKARAAGGGIARFHFDPSTHDIR